MYSQLTLRDAVLMLFGKAEPRLPFTVKAEPSSVYYNFAVKPEQAEAFERYITLPAGFRLAPMRCVVGEEPQLLLTLNVYEVTGLAVGIRAEWSTYIYDERGIGRYMVLEARSSEYSMDPVDIITKKGRVEHTMSDSDIRTVVASNDEQLFTCTLRMHDEQPLAAIAPEWMAANDFIYWRNGFCDRTYYGETMVNARVRQAAASDYEIDDATHWAPFIEAEPVHVLRYENALDLMITPWWGI
ncbi:MAG: hypothetical protein HKN19_03185 [Halioglobus sp.]|nr:hypothetical protein [Halioglobus sp.]